MSTIVDEPAQLEEIRRNGPPGLVIVPCHDQARYHQFTHDLTLLDVPDGSVINFQRSASVVQNLNAAVQDLMADEALEWAWFIADDHAFRRDVVLRLLARDLDIVVPLVTRRGPPYSLVVFDEHVGEDEYGRRMYHTIQFDELPPEGGLIELAACGSAGMLVKREVFEKIPFPWFENSDGMTCNEDVEFCRKAAEAGYSIYCDTDAQIGHIGNVAAWPCVLDGVWGIVFDFQGAGRNTIWMPGGVQVKEDGISTASGQVDW